MPSRGFYLLVLGLGPIALTACAESAPATADGPSVIPNIGIDLGSSARVRRFTGLAGEGEGYGRTEPNPAPAPNSPMSGMSKGSMAGMAMDHRSMPGTSRSAKGGMRMADAGHSQARGAGTVNSIDTAGRKIEFEPRPHSGDRLSRDDDGLRGRTQGRFTDREARHQHQLHDRAWRRRNVCHPVDHACRRGAAMIRNNPAAPVPVNRRRFVRGVAAAGALASVWPLRRALAVGREPVLTGTEFQLEIGPLPVNITGRPMTGTAINGQIPAPVLRWREGDTITLAVTNRLSEPTSIHWHGVRTPSAMDGVPGLSFAGIPPGQTFVYRFPVHQSGTYWYHSHSAFQEQTGVYGPIIIEPKGGYAHPFDRDYVVFLSDWSDEKPDTIVSNLKFQSDYYNFHQRTLGTFIDDVSRKGLSETISDRLMWGEMRMSPTDILDVSGSTYTYLMNGQPPASNWTALFRPGERVRLRFINGSSMSIFDVRIPDLPISVVQSDGNDLVPVTVDEFRIGTAETYDVIVQPREARAYTIFAQAEDRTGFARGTLAPRAGLMATIPPMDPRPMRTMKDMGMEHGSMGGMQMDHGSMPGISQPAPGGTQPMGHGSMPGMARGSPGGAQQINPGSMSAVQMDPSDARHEPRRDGRNADGPRLAAGWSRVYGSRGHAGNDGHGRPGRGSKARRQRRRR